MGLLDCWTQSRTLIRMNLRSLATFAVLLLPASACGDDASGDTDTDTDGQSGSSTTGDATSPSTSGPGTTSSSTEGSTTADASTTDDAESSSSTGDGDDSSTGEPPGEDICVGYAIVGTAGHVFNDGSGNGQPQCDTAPAACQGDVVGTWTAEDACGYEQLPNVFADVCPNATQQVTGSNLTGTQTFDEDGTYTFDTVLQIEADLQVDSMECAGLDCETFGDALSGEPGLEMICESAGGTACNCIYTIDLPNQSMGTWDLFDDGLLITDDSGEVQGLYDYCVADGRFRYWQPIYTETPFPDTTCSEDDECDGQVEGDFDEVVCEAPEDDKR